MKKIISLLLATVLVASFGLGLVSCGHEHEWSEWINTTDPTVFDSGEAMRSCECGETETKVVDAYGKAYVYGLLDGTWTEKNADTSGIYTKVNFTSNGSFYAYLYYGDSVMERWSGDVTLTDNNIILKTSSGALVIQFMYKVGNGAIAVLHIDGSTITEWVKKPVTYA